MKNNLISNLSTLFDRWNRINIIILAILFLPITIILFIIFLYKDHIEDERRKRKTPEQLEKESLTEKIKSGEIQLQNLPHHHKEGSNRFFFNRYDSSYFPKQKLLYVETDPVPAISDFIRNHKEEILNWANKYGFEVEYVKDQEKLFENMCFPKDKTYLKHGFLQDGNCYMSNEYDIWSEEFFYFELNGNSREELLNSLDDIAHEIYINGHY